MKRRNTQIGQMAMSAISVNVSPDQIKDLKELFIQLDANGDGTLTLEELTLGLAGREDAFSIM